MNLKKEQRSYVLHKILCTYLLSIKEIGTEDFFFLFRLRNPDGIEVEKGYKGKAEWGDLRNASLKN